MTTTRWRAGSRHGNTIASLVRHLRLPGFQLIITLLISIIPVASTPVSYFPLNAQLPPVARASQPFSFAFSPLTFSSDSTMSYSLADGSPSWLSLDSATRTLSGTPDEASVPRGKTLVGVDFSLVAHDNTGSTAANVTLVVSRNPGPIVQTPFEDQIWRFGAFSAPASALLHPSSEFVFEFDPNTFGVDVVSDKSSHRETLNNINNIQERGNEGGVKASRPQFNYYAVSGNNAPLPSWIAFDAEKLAFSGKTPSFESLIQPPQAFDFQLVASDVVGFSSASLKFSIVVGTHELTAKKSVIELNATRGKEFEFTDLSNVLEMDKRPLKKDDVTSVTAIELPKWLAFDEESWKVSGTPGAEELPTNVTIAIMDKFLDTLNVTLAIKFKTDVFVSDLPDQNASEGDDFSFDLKKFLVSPRDTLVKAEIQPDSSWIRFDDSAKVLSGTVPKPLTPDFLNDIRIAFNATQRRTKDEDTKVLKLKIHVDNKPTSTSTSAATSTASSTELPQPTHTSKPKGKGDDLRMDLYWLLIIPALLTIAGILLMLYLIRRRRQQSRKIDFSKVSGPVPGSFVANGAMGASSMDIPGPESDAPFMRSDTSIPMAPSNLRMAQATTPPSIIVVDHATSDSMVMHPGTSRSPSPENAIVKKQLRRLTGRPGQPSPAVTDEASLLSDTSLGEELHITEEHLSLKPEVPRGNPYGQKIGLKVPTIAEVRSIQVTPEIAYSGSNKYDFVSDDEGPPSTSHTERKKPARQQNTDNGLLGVQLLSKVWKRGSASKQEDSKRHSHISESTDVTTRTSILTSGITEEATTARASNVIAKPTVVHIPSRPGEARQTSRRADHSSMFFSGRSLTRSQRNTGVARIATPGPTYSPEGGSGPFADYIKEDEVQDSDTWDHAASNPLGIEYKDPNQAENPSGAPFIRRQEYGTGLAISEPWENDHTTEELMSPTMWPIPDGMAGSRHIASKDKSPVMPKGKGKKIESLTSGSGLGSSSTSSFSQASSTRPGAQGRSWREEGLRASRSRGQKALNTFPTTASQTPSTENEWLPGKDRQLPRTSSRANRIPLADRSNESGGLRKVFSKRSVRDLHSSKSIWRDGDGDGDDDDAWEDIVPPESVVGGWGGEESDRSFSVYI